MLNNKLDKLVLHSSSLTRSAICPRCGKYYPTLKALEAHRSVCENIVFATNNEEPEIEELREECQEHEEIIEEVPVAETTDRHNLFDRLNRMFGIYIHMHITFINA